MPLREAIELLQHLNEPVPIPAQLPTETEISSAQQLLGVRFPSEYRYFLQHASNISYGILEPARVTPGAGHLDLVEMVTTAWRVGVPGDLLPFCESNGDYYCITSDSQIVFWSHNRCRAQSWPDLAHWIQQVWIDEFQEMQGN